VSSRFQVPFSSQLRARLAVRRLVLRGPCSQPVDVAVVHGKSRGDQHGVVNLKVGRSFAPCTLNIFIFGLNRFATAPDLFRKRQQCFELVRNRRTDGILFNILNQRFIATEMIGRDRAVDFMSKNAIVLRRNVTSDEFPLPSGKGARPLQQNFR